MDSTSAVRQAPAVDPPELRQFLLGLAEAMTAAAESVDTIYAELELIVAAYSIADAEFVVLPTALIVQTGGMSGRVAIRSVEVASFHFHQISALYSLLNRAERAEVDPADGIRELAAIEVMKPRFNWVLRTLGHAVLTVGLSLLLIPTWRGMVLSFGLGVIIGLVKLVRSPHLQLILPTASAFVCAAVVFASAQFVGLGDPALLLIAPIATFLPGASLTSATVELASGQMVAGASRLVAGLVELALLACGILAAGAILGVGTSNYVAVQRAEILPWWVAPIGVLLYSIGIYFYLSVPGSTFGWVVLIVFVAYGAQTLGAGIAGPTFSGFIGALVVTPAVLWIAGLHNGAPSQITFLPAFWFLVPGVSGLVGLTEVAVGEADTRTFATALITVLSIALGVLIGTALFRSTAAAFGRPRVVGE